MQFFEEVLSQSSLSPDQSTPGQNSHFPSLMDSVNDRSKLLNKLDELEFENTDIHKKLKEIQDERDSIKIQLVDATDSMNTKANQLSMLEKQKNLFFKNVIKEC